MYLFKITDARQKSKIDVFVQSKGDKLSIMEVMEEYVKLTFGYNDDGDPNSIYITYKQYDSPHGVSGVFLNKFKEDRKNKGNTKFIVISKVSEEKVVTYEYTGGGPYDPGYEVATAICAEGNIVWNQNNNK